MLANEARAESPEEKGLAIAIESDKRDLGYGDFEADGEMVLKDKGGRESRRVFRNMTFERADNGLGDLGVIVFEKPRDIRGTALLTHAQIEPSDDDQWLYLPSVKRVKRISSSNRTGKFVSSEFSYEDLGSQEVNDYTYHHGYYDGLEREFRGFGMVETWDTESFEAFSSSNSS